MTRSHLARISWSARFETGIDLIDDDHRHLIGLLNCLAEACEQSCRKTTLEVLGRIEVFLLEHFAREESLFDKCSCEHAAQHREEHRQMYQEVAHQLEDLYEADYSLTSVAVFLHGWLMRHLTTSDCELGKMLNPQFNPQQACAACPPLAGYNARRFFARPPALRPEPMPAQIVRCLGSFPARRLPCRMIASAASSRAAR